MNKYIIGVFALTTGLLFSASPIFAHVVVKPYIAGVASFTDFSLGVPSEKETVNTIAVKLILPAGLGSISPVVKPGWKVEVKNGSVPAGVLVQPDDDGNIPTTIPVEIDWTGGSIPAGQKDFFVFSAQVPAKETELDWKVIQTYADGSTISWIKGSNDSQPQDSTGKPDYSQFGPFSKTLVVNDLKASVSPVASNSENGGGGLALGLAVLALGISALALGMQYKKR